MGKIIIYDNIYVITNKIESFNILGNDIKKDILENLFHNEVKRAISNRNHRFYIPRIKDMVINFNASSFKEIIELLKDRN
jgi:hypothetical protein